MFLEEAASASRARSERRSESVSEDELDRIIAGLGPGAAFSDALRRDGNGARVIAEVKRVSPSAGSINEMVDVEEQAGAYRRGGASAVSVITCEYRFRGELADLQKAKNCGLPLLRKDFITSSYQVKEARANGASAVLLIVALLREGRLEELLDGVRAVGLEALVEVHSEEEMASACAAGAKIIGINNRDLRTLEVDLATTEKLFPQVPDGVISVCESGIRERSDVLRMEQLGVDALLVGEALMRAGDPEIELERLMGKT